MPSSEKKSNSQGKRFFGLHFYPGVAEYAEPGKKPYRVFLNENTLREMDRTFEGRPVFVMHVDGVEQDIDKLKGQVDGWVLRSFYNQADGKHWVEFLVVSEKAEDVIKKGWQLSNSYFPKSFAQGGLWNGVQYDKEITGGEYEHLALVPNPRYEESVIMSPEEFKQYNEELQLELDQQRIANASKERGMSLKFWKREKVENGDLENMIVLLPLTKREVSIGALVNEADAMMAHPKHMVDMGDGNKMTVGDLHNRYNAMKEELAAYAKNAEEKESEVEEEKEGVDVEGDDKAKDNDDTDVDPVIPMSTNDDDSPDKSADITGGAANEDDKTDKEVKEEKKKNDIEAAKAKKTEDAKKAKVKADALKNAEASSRTMQEAKVILSEDKVARGVARYGSGK